MKTAPNKATETTIKNFASAIEAAKLLTRHEGRSAECNRIADAMNAAGVATDHPLRAAVHEAYFWEFFENGVGAAA
jgi:predicted outer membrane protein